MTPNDLSLRALGRAYRDGSLTPLGATRHFLQRIEALDPTLKAFTAVTRERALAEATRASEELGRGEDRGPLHGVPYAVKDHFDVAGVATMVGCSLLADNIAAADCAAVTKLSAAGMVLLGKCHTVQFAGGITGVNQDLGTPHNPWKEEHHAPGGSSSGSAVAVAGSLAPVALGGDTGGSVRVPAALCGIVGLKTTLGRITRAGVHPMAPTLDTVGIFGRRVEDCALVYQTLQGPDTADATTLGREPHDVLANLEDGLAGRQLVVPRNVFFDNCDAEVESAVRQACERMRALGALVLEREIPEIDAVMAMTKRFAIVAVETYVNHKRLFEEQADKLDPLVAWVQEAKRVTGPEYLEALQFHDKIKRDTAERLRDVDGLLCPTTLMPALPISEIAPDLGQFRERYKDDAAERYTRNASMGNQLGLCGISLPCGFTEKGLPIGLQIYAKAFREDVALSLAAAFEADRLEGADPEWPAWIESLAAAKSDARLSSS